MHARVARECSALVARQGQALALQGHFGMGGWHMGLGRAAFLSGLREEEVTC